MRSDMALNITCIEIVISSPVFYEYVLLWSISQFTTFWQVTLYNAASVPTSYCVIIMRSAVPTTTLAIAALRN
jgi:hypothetical protein